jgi:YihY family inner membrane protein
MSGATTPDPDETGAGQPPSDGSVIDRAVGAGRDVVARVDSMQRGRRPLAIAFAVFKKFGDDQAGNLAALIAYYAFFSLFPLLLVLVTVVGYVLAGNPDLQQRLLDSAVSQFPVIGDQLRTNIGEARGSGIALVVGVIGALWGGLGALDAMQNAMNSVWNVPKVHRPNLLQTRLRGLIMLVVLATAITASTALGSAGSYTDRLGPAGTVVVLALTAVLNAGLFTMAFKVLTNVDIDWRAQVPGAIVAGIAFTLLQAAGGWYVERVLRNASEIYGTFAVVLGLLSWLYLLAQVTVFAAEINVVVHRDLVPRSLSGADLTTADHEALRNYAEVEARVPEETVHVELPDPPVDA